MSKIKIIAFLITLMYSWAIMNKNIKNVQVKIDKDLHLAASVELLKKRMSWQEFLQSYIEAKYGKRKK